VVSAINLHRDPGHWTCWEHWQGPGQILSGLDVNRSSGLHEAFIDRIRDWRSGFESRPITDYHGAAEIGVNVPGLGPREPEMTPVTGMDAGSQ
jgi:hypothetical protein